MLARHVLPGFALLVGLGLGCGGNGLGCGAGSALPSDPAPWGMPMEQAIEGGVQARITRPGFAKLTSLIPALTQGLLPTQAAPLCMGVVQQALKIAGTGGDVRVCNAQCGAGTGCPLWVDLRKDVVPPGGIALSMADGSNPVVNVDAAFDVHVDVPIQHRLCLFGLCQNWQNDCAMRFDGPATHINGHIPLAIDPVTGKLIIEPIDLALLGLNFSASNCGLLGDVLDFVLTVVQAIAKTFVGQAIVDLLRPQLTQLVNGFLPDPPGLASRLDLATALASFLPPKEAALELLAIAGGYVSAQGGGLNLGVIAGANSDRDPTTRGPRGSALNHEPSLCVPARPPYDLGKAPFNLPLQPQRLDFTLDPAPAFAGSPDPVDAMGQTQDLALGVSRTFLDQLGFHLVSSGSLCLQVGGSTLMGLLTSGTLRALLPSLGNILEDPKAPVLLVLRPEQPLVFRLGAGGVPGPGSDPLLHVGVTDLRVDFYGFLEERYVRLLTLAADMDVGINLTPSMTADGLPAVTLMLAGIDKSTMQVRVTNTDLLTEAPTAIGKTLGSLLSVAVGQLGGALQPIALPALMGFSLDGLQIGRVQTAQDDFLAIVGNLVRDPNSKLGLLRPAPPSSLARPGTAGLGLAPGGLVGAARPWAPVAVQATIVDRSVPPPEVFRAAAAEGRVGDGDTPSITLSLASAPDAPDSPGAPGVIEWSWRLDGGWWHDWSADPRPTIADPTLLLQGRHGLDVRARRRGDGRTEGEPQRLAFVIDSTPPELTIAVDARQQAVAFGATDNVSEPAALRFSWSAAGATPSGQPAMTEPAPRSSLSFAEAWAATGGGREPLVVIALDEEGNQARASVRLSSLPGFPARLSGAQAAGCGCDVGAGARPGPAGRGAQLALVVGLLALAIARRRVRRA